MTDTLSALELKREHLYLQLQEIGDFRRGTISVLYRKCGKKNCACAQVPEHPGHGPLYLWNATIGGKSYAKNIKLGPELEKYQAEIANHQRYQKFCQELVSINEQICALRPVRVVEDESDLAMLKKKLQQQFQVKCKKK